METLELTQEVPTPVSPVIGAAGGISGASVSMAVTDWVNHISCPGVGDQLSCLNEKLQSANGVLIAFALGTLSALIAHGAAAWISTRGQRRAARRRQSPVPASAPH